MTTRRLAYCLLIPSLGLAAIGCSTRYDDLPREPVAGNVTMDGEALSEAMIQFSPTGETKSTGANAQVKDGQFSIPREDGLVPGTYKVSISRAELKDVPAKSSRIKGPPSSIPSRTKRIGPELIPARYNAKSELTAEIKPGGTKDLNFPLKSK